MSIFASFFFVVCILLRCPSTYLLCSRDKVKKCRLFIVVTVDAVVAATTATTVDVASSLPLSAFFNFFFVVLWQYSDSFVSLFFAYRFRLFAYLFTIRKPFFLISILLSFCFLFRFFFVDVDAAAAVQPTENVARTSLKLQCRKFNNKFNFGVTIEKELNLKSFWCLIEWNERHAHLCTFTHKRATHQKFFYSHLCATDITRQNSSSFNL